MNINEFATRIKEKYPEYSDVDDTLLAKRIVEKYPEYKDQIDYDFDGDVSEAPSIAANVRPQQKPQHTELNPNKAERLEPMDHSLQQPLPVEMQDPNWALNTIRKRETKVSPSGIESTTEQAPFAEATQAIAAKTKHNRDQFVAPDAEGYEKEQQQTIDDMRSRVEKASELSWGYEGGVMKPRLKHGTDGEYSEIALNMLKEAEKVKQSGKKGLIGGIGDAMSDPNLYVGGLLSVRDNARLQEVLAKEEKGAELTQAENDLLDAAAYLTAAQMSADPSIGYQIGKSLPESAAFMAQMLATAGTGAIAPLTAKLASRYVSRYGAKGLAKLGGKTLKNAAIVTGTFGAPNVLSDYVDRSTGDVAKFVDPSTMEEKHTVLNKEGGLEAAYKATMSSYIENLTEMGGAVLSPAMAPVKNAAGKMLPSSVKAIFGSINASDAVSTVRDLTKRMAWDGVPEEYLEEVAGTILNSLLVGDSQLSDLLDVEQQLVTLGSVAIMSGVMGGAQGVGYGIDRYQTAKELTEATARLQDAGINPDNIIDQDGHIIDGNVFNSLPIDQKEDLYGYYVTKAKMEGLRLGVDKHAQEAADRAASEILQNANVDNGQIIRGLVDDQTDEVLVIGGDTNDPQAILTIQRQDGTIEQMPSHRVLIVQQEEAQRFAQEAAEAARMDVLNKEAEAIAYRPESEVLPGKQVTIGGNTYTVHAVNDGMAVLLDVSGMTIPMPVEDVRDILEDQLDVPQPVIGQEIPVDGQVYTVVAVDSDGTIMRGEDGKMTKLPTTVVGQAIAQSQQPAPGQNAQVDPAEQPQQEVIEQPAVEQPAAPREFPRDADGNIDYAQLTTGPDVAEALLTEFGTNDALAIIDQQIADVKARAEKASKKGTPIDQARAKRKFEAERMLYEQAKASLEATVKAETEAAIRSTITEQQTPVQGENVPQIEADEAAATQTEVNVPDMALDKASDARIRGFRMDNGQRIERQAPITAEQAITGSQTTARFSVRDEVPTTFAVIDARQAQPSHKAGRRNPLFFINEAQPKERTDVVSDVEAERIASNMNPEEITSSVSAYTGSPITNERGEVIQGNNRTMALQKMYEKYPEQAAAYKQYLIDNAERFGLDAEELAGMEQPMLVRMGPFADDEAIRLGQKRASDNESGGQQRIDAKSTLKQLGDKSGNFMGILYNSDNEGDESLSDVVRQNARTAITFLHRAGIINSTQFSSAFNERGDVKPETVEDLIGITKEVLFKGGKDNLEIMFRSLPDKAKKAILQTVHRDNGEMVPVLQEAIEVYYHMAMDASFSQAKTAVDATRAAIGWYVQTQMDFTTGQFVPRDRYSVLAMSIAVSFRAETQKSLTSRFDGVYDAILNQGGDLFGEPVKMTKEEAIREYFNTQAYERNQQIGDVALSRKEAGPGGQQGSSADNQSQGQGAQGELPSVNPGDTEPGNRQPAQEGGITQGLEKPKTSKPSEKNGQQKPIGKLGTGANIYYQSKYYRVNDFQKDGSVVLIIHTPDSSDSMHYDSPREAMDALRIILGEFPTGAYINGKYESFNVIKIKERLYSLKEQKKQLTEQEAAVDTNPTEAQKEAGNYKKGHINVQGMDITIEQPKGSTRSGVDENGREWSTEMQNTYGYFKRTEGKDGDQVDVFLGDNLDSDKVFIIDQKNPKTGAFDESKVMLGFDTAEQAKAAYMSNYEQGWNGFMAITPHSVEDFKKWLYDGVRQRKPFSEYVGTPAPVEVSRLGVKGSSEGASQGVKGSSEGASQGVKPEYGGSNTLVSKERYEELREQMRKKLNNLNVGFDPEVFTIGAQMAMYHIEAGAHKFADFAKRMVEDLGQAVIPYLKSIYEGARFLPGMNELSKKMDTSADVADFDVEQINDTTNDEQERKEERTVEAIEAEAEAAESATTSITAISHLAGNNQQRAGEVKDQVDKQVNKVEALIDEVDAKIAKLTELGYSTEGIDADTPVRVLAKGPIKKDMTKFVKTVAQLTGLETEKAYDGVLNLNIATAGGNVSFFLWSKEHPQRGVYVSIPIEMSMDENGESHYYVPSNGTFGYILWRAVRRDNKYNGSNQYMNSFVTAEEMANNLLAGLNRELRGLGLKEVEKPVVATNEANKKKQIGNTKRRKSDANTLSLFGDATEEPQQDNHQKPSSDVNRTQRGSQAKGAGLGTEERQEAEGLQRVGVDQSSTDNTSPVQVGSRGISELPAGDSSRPVNNQRNNRNERGVDYAPKSPKARFNANIAAIILMRKLVDGSVTVPTREQMEILRKYSGWGGLGTYFNSTDAENAILRETITPEEYEAAELSINSAYFTPAAIIDSLWDVATKLGFKGGNILESSAGIGSIIGSIPEGINARSTIEGVEIDPVSGNILKLLYPDANIHINGFEDTNIKNGSVDLAITNVPFVTGLSVNDKVDSDLSKKFKNIHDFFIAKNIRKLRDGGIGIFITSSGTLDKSRSLREWIVKDGKADVIGAFRLNNDTFGGTNVTSDIIIVRKRIGNKIDTNAIDVLDTKIIRTEEYETGETDYVRGEGWVRLKATATMEYNNYFVEHPENMGGEMAFGFEHGETYRQGGAGLYPSIKRNQDEALAAWIGSFKKLSQTTTTAQEQPPMESTESKEGTLLVNKSGQICVSVQGEAKPIDTNNNKVKGQSKAQVLGDYNYIKQSLNRVLYYQLNNENDEGLFPLLRALNNAYDRFVSRYGNLNRNTAISFLKNDVDFPSIAALEEQSDDDESKYSKTAVFKGRVIGFKSEPEPKTIKDAVIASMYTHGAINLDYISEKLKMPVESVKEEILQQRLGFVNPENGSVDVRYEYLSGNVRKKLQLAKDSNVNGEYNANIEELEGVVPMDIPAHLIGFSFGSSWIDPTLYRRFISDRLSLNSFELHHSEGAWIFRPSSGKDNDKNRQAGVYSEKLGIMTLGSDLFAAALNNQPVVVKTVVKHSDGTSETIYDKDASQACTTKISEIKDDFKDWAKAQMQSDEALAEKIMREYNDKFNAIVPKSIDNIFLPESFGGSANDITLYPHQKKSVIRGTTEPLMLAHEVGSGKTFTLITTAMEMRRIGTARKPMIVVQNATVGQFVTSAKRLYPNANVLTITDRDRTPEGRREFYGKIKYSDWDMIIIPQSVFEMIPDSPEREMTFIKEKIDDKLYALEAMKAAGANERLIKDAEKELGDLNDELASISTGKTVGKKNKKKDSKADAKKKANAAAKAEEQLTRRTDDVQYFDDLGVDAILVDEAHEYKRLGFSTSMTRGVKGIDPAGSKKAASIYLKSRAILEKNGWKNVIFATGTPISNTAAEIWTFMKYLIPKEVMKENDIYYFDDFVRNFGNITQSIEFATNGKFKENTRFASYINTPELIRLWASVSDTVLTKDIDYVNDKIPAMETGKAQDIFLPQSDSLVDIMRAVRASLDEFEKMTGKEKKANSHIPLTMYGIAKRAAIDPRLVDSKAPDEPLSKTNRAVEETLRTLKETEDYNGTVAIFCDNQNRWDKTEGGGRVVGFDLFEDIKQKLITAGVPEEQIVVIKSGMTVARKEKIFADVNAGTIRVVIGNTKTLGTGVNIQQRLHTLIHMDAPDRPMDYTQRNGRILRQGNMHKVWDKAVRVLRFGVEDSLDVTSYQRLKTKAGFIDSIMDGNRVLSNSMDANTRTLEEEEEGLFDNPVAVLSGSQYAMLKNAAEREYRKLNSKKQQHEADQIYVTNRLRRNKGIIADNLAQISERQERLDIIEKAIPDGKPKSITLAGKPVGTDALMESALKDVVNKVVSDKTEAARSNAYFKGEIVSFKLAVDSLDFNIMVDITRESSYDNKARGFRIIMHRNVSYSCQKLGLEGIPVSGGYVKNAITDILDNVVTGRDDREAIEAITRSNNRLTEENASMAERVGKEFTQMDELAAARRRVDEYTELMRKELEEKDAKYAERGSKGATNISEAIDDAIEVGDNDDVVNESDSMYLADSNDGENEIVNEAAKGKNAIQTQLEWDEALPFQRNEAISLDSSTDGVQRKGYQRKYKHTGGVTNVERILSDEGHLQFLGAPLTGGAKITGPEDIAFLFKNLESAATENAFAVLLKPDDTYEVLYLSTGGTGATIIDVKLVMTAAIKTGADRVVLVHNHPSGMLTPSPGDKALQSKAELAAKSVGIKMLPGVIINLDSGKFLQYDTYNGHDVLSTNNTKVRKDQRKVSVLKFDRLKLYQPTIDMPHIVSSRDVAQVLSSFKRGTTEKTHVLISNNAGTITRYFLTGDEVGSPKFMKWLVAEAGTHGNNVFLASNNTISAKVVRDIKSVLENMDIHLFDVLTIKQDEDIIHNYNSMADDGLLEPASTYGPSEVNDPGVIEVNGVQRPTTDNDGSFDPDKGDIRFRHVSDNGFYSTVEAALEVIKQEKGTADQFKAMLLKNGAKQAELDWMDWEAFASDKKSITKADIQEWVGQNRIEVQEVAKSLEDGSTKYYDYATPGGENYTELLLTIPENEGNFKSNHWDKRDFESYHWEEKNILAHIRYDERTSVNGERVLFIEELQSDWAQKGKKNGFFTRELFKSSLAGKERELQQAEENLKKAIDREVQLGMDVNAHVFERVLFGQPSWLKKNHKEYGRLSQALDDVRSKRDFDSITERMKAIEDEYEEATQAYSDARELVKHAGHNLERAYNNLEYDKASMAPDMPFKKTDQWVNLVIRRMMHYAAENGFDRIAWTTGEQQVERYDLSKQVSSISAEKTSKGDYKLEIDIKGRGLQTEYTTEQKMPDIIGKDLSEKIISNGGGFYSGLELKVGGEGMRAFYDNIIPSAASKLGKPFGASVEDTSIDGITSSVQSLPVTDKMVDSVTKGVPLFRAEDAGTLTVIEAAKMVELKSFFDRLAKGAKNAGKVNVVSDRASLPLYIQKLIPTDTLVPGLYMDKRGESYFILSEIRNVGEAFKTWVHEIGAHHGLRNIIPAREFKSVMIKLYEDLGPAEIHSGIPKKYWDLPMHVQAEEYLAYLAERIIKQEDLGKKEKSAWEKIIDAVVTVLNKLFKNAKFTKQDAENIVLASVHSIYNGDGGGRRILHLLPGLSRENSNKGSEKGQDYQKEVSQIKESAIKGGTWLIAPNGEPSNLSQEQWLQVRTKAFKSWFGDWEDPKANASVVIDKNGEPAVLFHGTRGEFDVFKTIPAWFASDASLGQVFTQRNGGARSLKGSNGTRPHLYSQFINIRKPFNIEGYMGRDASLRVFLMENIKDSDMVDSFLRDMYENSPDRKYYEKKNKELIKKGEDPILVAFDESGSVAYYERGLDPASIQKPKELSLPAWKWLYNGYVVDGLRRLGFDGTISTERGVGAYSVFAPNQIKSAIENNGDFKSESDNVTMRIDNGVRLRVADDAKADINRINKSIKEAKIIEAVQDRMVSVKRLIQDIEKNGEKVESWENPYLYENTTSSVSTYEMEVYKNEYLKPLTKAFADLAERMGGVIDARVYMFAKHALERNEKMRADKAVEDPEADVDNMDFAGVGPLGQHILGDVAEGLSIPEIEEELRTFIQETEDTYAGSTSRLWEAVNRATKKTLSKWFESGLMGAEQYALVRDMYDYYVPLRGFNEPVAGDVYEYMTSGESGSFQSVVKSAKGRKSMADDPLANISSMAASGIIAGNKNMMKQRMLWMARNHKSPFYNVDKVWYVNDGTEERPSWREVAPEYQPGDTEEQRLQIAQDFYDRMTELEGRGEAKKERKRLKTGYRMSPYQAKEHQIEVYEMGKKYIININGDPSVAQAINGTNRGDMNDNELLKAMGWLNRQMAANFTVRNPTFVVRNLVRDILYSSSMHTVREGRAYAKAFRGNIPVAMGAAWRYLNGKTTNASVDNHFVDFLKNGGETGYVNLSDFKQHKRDIERMIREANGSMDYKKAFTAVIAAVRMVNRWAELVGRFATYLTSIQSGRDVVTSIANSKDATVNFNRKGTGKALSKDLGKKAYISTLFLPYFRNSQLFFNASIQGVANFVNAAGKNPGRFTATLGKYVAIGAITPMLSAILAAILSGDDDEDGNLYWDIPSYVRRNNFVICFGSKYLAIPLPIELRAFYGLGEIMTEQVMGKSDGGNAVIDGLHGFVDAMSPVEVGKTALRKVSGSDAVYIGGLLPDALVPFYEAFVANEDWLGYKISKDSPFNQHAPQFQKAYSGTNRWLVKGSELLNTLSGGDNVGIRGTFDPVMLNPAKVEHILESYFGGVGKTVNQVAKITTAAIDHTLGVENPQAVEMRDIPVISGFTGSMSQERRDNVLRDKFYELTRQHDKYKHDLGVLRDSPDIIESAQKIDKLASSTHGQKMSAFGEYRKQYDRLYREYKEQMEAGADSYSLEILNDEMKQIINEAMEDISNE